MFIAFYYRNNIDKQVTIDCIDLSNAGVLYLLVYTQITSSGIKLIILQRMDLYALATATISAGFCNRLRLVMILSGKAVVSKHWFECLQNFIRQFRNCFEFIVR
ncbi:hypothetical protein B5G04_15485 [Bacteroides sp. An51A]|nr:hypothetical protein B5G04_15485 [Bacteroides sp. An51A]